MLTLTYVRVGKMSAEAVAQQNCLLHECTEAIRQPLNHSFGTKS